MLNKKLMTFLVRQARHTRKPAVGVHLEVVEGCNHHWRLAALLIANLLASWSPWFWLVKRASDGSDDPWGVVALLTLVVLVWRERAAVGLPNLRQLSLSALLTVLSVVSWGVLPPLLATTLALLSLAALLYGLLPEQRPLLPLLMLLLLALPLVASLNFYLGYPLRWFCAQATAHALSLLELTVTPQGAALWWNGQSILIDAPCAGIAMLWLGWYLSALFSYLHTATVIRSVFNLAIASVVVVIANVLRNILLFYKEAGIVQLPHWAHEAIGLLVFALVIPLIYQATAQHGFAQDRTRQAHPERNHRFAIRPKAVKGRIQQNSFVCFIVVMLVCGLYPLGFAKPEAFAQAAPPMEQNWAFDRWATATKTVFPLPLTALEQRFARDFPGEIGRFSNGNTVWVVRHIRRATRLLHPATDCYRGLGYQVSKTHVVQQADHTRWQCFIAERGQKLRVCERIFDKQNRQWTDVSAWYWENLRPKSLQEWWAITEVHPAGNDDVLAMGGL